MNIWHSASYNPTIHALPQFAAALTVMLWITLVLVRERGSRVSALLFLLGLAASGGYLSAGFSFSSTSDALSTFWTRTGFTSLSFIPGAVFHFSMSVLRLEQINRGYVRLMWGVSLAFAPLPHGTDHMIPGIERYWWGTTASASWLNSALLIGIWFTTLVCLWHFHREFRRARPGSLHRRRVKAYLWAIGVGVLTLVDFLPEVGLDTYPVGFVFMTLFLVLATRATWRYRLVDLTPAFAARQLLETMQGAVLVTDEEDRIQLANRAACEMLRGHEEDLLGTLAGDLMTVARVKGGTTRDIHPRWRTLDGHLVDVSVSASALTDRDGRPAGTVYAAMDISPLRATQAELTALSESLEQRVQQRSAALEQRAAQLEQEVAERQRAEAALKEAYDELRSTQRQLLQSEKMAAIGQLAAGVAHEINNPAGFVLSNLETMQDYAKLLLGELATRQELANAAAAGEPGARDALLSHLARAARDEEQQYLREDCPEVLADTLEGADRIRDIVLNLKTYAHPGDEQVRQVDLNHEIERALLLTANELKYTCEVVKDLQPLPPVSCHNGQLGQVFVNLLVNASQAMEDGGRISVRSFPRRGEGGITVEIEDDGPGMSEQVRAHVFEPFFTTKEEGKGTGLGLSIVHDIILRHQGTIEVRSAPGQGTTFTINLPEASGAETNER